MASDVTREEFRNLEARVDVVEREVDGEKLVTRHILQETRRNSGDLAAIKSRLDRHDERFDTLERKFDGLSAQFDALKKTLPEIVGDVVRDVFREHDIKKTSKK